MNDIAFERRFSSIDIALLSTAVEFAPGTVRHAYFPLPFEVPIQVLAQNSLIEVEEVDTELRAIYWFLSDTNLESFEDEVTLEIADEEVIAASREESDDEGSGDDTVAEDDLECPDGASPTECFNLFKTGKQIAFTSSDLNALQLTCPVIDTEVEDWERQQIFLAKVLASGDDYSNEDLPTNRIAQVLSTQHSQIAVSDDPGSGTVQAAGSLISAIPAEAEIVIALGDAGESREPGSLVVYYPVFSSEDEEEISSDDEPQIEYGLKARKLACFIVNDLLTAGTSVYYAQAMPVDHGAVADDSRLRVFRERSSPDQLMVFIDISRFQDDQVMVGHFATAVYKAIQRYYGQWELPPAPGPTLSFTVTPEMAQALIAAVPGQPINSPGVPGQLVSSDPPREISGSGDNPIARMRSVCSQTRLSLADGMQKLKEITPYWVQQSQRDGAVYIRGGRTGRDGSCRVGGQNWWVAARLAMHFSDFTLPASCTQGGPGDSCLALPRSSGKSSMSSDCKAMLNRGGTDCTGDLRSVYQRRIGDPLANRYLCGDCGTYLLQLYECAFGAKSNEYPLKPTHASVIAATPGAISGYSGGTGFNADQPIMNKQRGASRETWGTPGGSCWDQAVQRVLGGQLQFGDVIQLPGHYVMYTGGAGLPFEIVEMGGWSWPGATPSTYSTQIGNRAFGGVRTLRSAQEALSGSSVQTGCIIRRVGEEIVRYSE